MFFGVGGNITASDELDVGPFINLGICKVAPFYYSFSFIRTAFIKKASFHWLLDYTKRQFLEEREEDYLILLFTNFQNEDLVL